MSSDFGAWWEALTTATLVGTARRQVPPLPAPLGTGRADVTREVALLDAAALGGTVRRAGSRTRGPQQLIPADDDGRTLPARRAVQLLELVLRQSPVAAPLVPDLVQVWLAAADAAGQRAPHHLLPELLELATTHERLQPAVRSVGDRRGAWLAAVNPRWGWAAQHPTSDEPGTSAVEVRTWAQQPTEERVGDLVRLRATDPAAARRLVGSTWSTDSVDDRVRLLSALRTGIGPDDEPLLEQALDDRSAKVRDVAATLLDALPGSARATRMAARLRPLLQVRGLLRKTLEVELPPDPDTAGVRDGLSSPKRVGSVRGWWLQRLAAGAPLAVWTDTTGSDPAGAWRMVTQRDARVGIAEAVLARGDREWASAIAADVWHPGLLALLPAAELDTAAARQLAAATHQQVAQVVAAVPDPWGPSLSRAVLQRLMAEKDPALLLGQLAGRLATGLDPLTRPALDSWAARLAPGARQWVARISQYLALVTEIPEAFR